ncbi:MAG TPA: Ig-like domain-containing protein, partial [Gemmatimonadaceae bacterium]|nr:Ig-like domain-containing protein [Gemmatimonadaceae bacterium]
MPAPADTPRSAPMRRLALMGLVLVAAIISCRDVTGPGGSRFARGLSWNAIFPGPLRDAGVASSGVVNFDRVHVVLHHSDGSVALDTTIDYPSGADSVTVSLAVRLLNNAPASGEPMSLNLGYVDAAGDTVFKGGPIQLTAAPPPAGGGVNPPVQVPVTYSGPGASASSVVIAPRTQTVVAGGTFAFTAAAKDGSGNTLAGTPVIWTSLDPTVATISKPDSGGGSALTLRGTARILAQLLTGPTDTVQVTVTLPASQLIKPATGSGDGQSATVGAALALPIVVKVGASDGVGVGGTTVTFTVSTGGGSVSPATAVSDSNGLAHTTWTLGTGAGTQSVTVTAASLTNQQQTYTANGAAGVATKLAFASPPTTTAAATPMPIVVYAQDANSNTVTSFTGSVSLALNPLTSGGTLVGTTSTNAILGIAALPVGIAKAFNGYTIVASAAGLTSATSAAFNITPGAAKLIVPDSGFGQTGIIGTQLANQITVRVIDTVGNGVPGKTVTFGTTSGSGSVNPTSFTTDANGRARTTWTLGPNPGVDTATAAVSGLTTLKILAGGFPA